MPANFLHQAQSSGGPPPPSFPPLSRHGPEASSGSGTNPSSVPAATSGRDNLLGDIRNFGTTLRLKVRHMFFLSIIIPIFIDFSNDGDNQR